MTIRARLPANPPSDSDRFRTERARMPALADGLSTEDLAAQSMPDCSPGKWHLAHTSWFFEAMILARRPGYQPVDPRWQVLFNSYYDALGDRVARDQRGLMTRPGLDEVLAYRAEVDRRMVARLDDGLADDERYLFVLGLHHDQQHQELFLMDLLHLMSCSPLNPAAYVAEPGGRSATTPMGGFTSFQGGLVSTGANLEGFAFDNEGPRHQTFLQPFAIANDLVTNEEWIAFIDDGGYRRPELWLSDGWACARREGWTAPLYWQQEGDGWRTMSLTGLRDVEPTAAVRHVSFYEADAFARWSGRRLPTEAEWEHAATSGRSLSGLFGEVWQWTSSAYAPYPGFRPTPGTASEYNGKFMANQVVLRGSSLATPPGHERATYRNFFYPHQRWAFMGLRLATDAASVTPTPDDPEVARFRDALIAGLGQSPKAVSPKWFYDAEGSRLFEEITQLAEYYPTRQETGLLRRIAPELAARFGPGATLVEFGSGASEKTRILLDAALDLAAYVPIDISPDALNEAADRIRTAYPRLKVIPITGDFLHLGALPSAMVAGRRVGFFPGSTIGNLSEAEAVTFLKDARERLGEGALFILGVDLVKDPATLVAAYDDAQGVTAAFNKNLLVRANAELGADFDLDAFDHRAVWNAEASRMQMHLVARCAQTVMIAGRAFQFELGESIHTESSRKFTEASIREMASQAGWRLLDLAVSGTPSVAIATLSN